MFMGPLPRGLAITAALAASAGCVDQPDDLRLSSTAGLTFEEFKARTYREPASGLYVLDWDTPVSGDAELYRIWESTVQGALAVYTANGQDVKWDANQRKNLTYCISNNFGANKQAVIDAMRTASDAGWERFADVNFTYVPAQDGNCTAANPNVLFDVNPVNANGQYLARAFFPNSPRGERNVLIDNVAFQPGGTGGVPLTNILAHELGHTLGFRHEHIRPEANATGCIEDDQFRGLTTYDSASVMHYPQCNGTATNLAFTQRDQQGVVALYGSPVTSSSPVTQVNFPLDGDTVGQSFEVDAAIVDTDLVKAELFVDGMLKQTLMSPPFTFRVSNIALGMHEIEVRATDGAGQTANRTLMVTVTENGPGTGSGGGPGLGGEGVPNGIGEQVSGGCNAAGSGGVAGVLLALLGLVGLVRRRR
jgi:uncharacterized protein (TIGR03382 family)